MPVGRIKDDKSHSFTRHTQTHRLIHMWNVSIYLFNFIYLNKLAPYGSGSRLLPTANFKVT